MIAALGIQVTHVNPRAWKAALKVPAAKDGARCRASELIHGGAAHWPLVKHDGRAEACLIALFGIRTMHAIAAGKAALPMEPISAGNDPPGALVGPDSVPAEASTMRGIMEAQEAQLEVALRLREPGPHELKAGETPRIPSGPWSASDLLGREPPTGVSPDGADPSGVDRNRGVGR